jgi:hypothetical protein
MGRGTPYRKLSIEDRVRKTEEERKKVKVRKATLSAIKYGFLKRMPCEICGGKSEAHHEDYDQPTKIRWLCNKHHNEIHRK